MANVDDPIGSKNNPPTRSAITWTLALALALVGALEQIGKGLEHVGEMLEKLWHAFMLFLTFLGIQGGEISTVKSPDPPVSEYHAPFSMPGTAYGGPTGPITSKPNFADDARQPPRPAMARAKSATVGETTASAPPNVITRIFHFICPQWFPAPEDTGKNLN